MRPLAWLRLATLGLVSCAVAPPAPATSPPARAPRPVATRPAPTAARSPAPLSLPLWEDDFGIAGGPRDDTSFEFEPEIAGEQDRAPVLDGVGPLSGTVIRSLGPYLEARRARLASTAPDGRRMLVLTRLAETTQVHLLDAPLGARRQVTFGAEPVTQASFVPGARRSLAFRSDVQGDEDHQIFLLDVESGKSAMLTDGRSRHGAFCWSPRGRVLAFTGTQRNGIDTDLYVWSGHGPPRRILEVEGQWLLLGWSQDGTRLLAREYRSASESTLHVVEIDAGVARPLAPLQRDVSHAAGLFHPAGGRLYVTSDRDSDVVDLFEVDVVRSHWRRLTASIPWDVEEITLSADGGSLAFTTNEDGVSVLRLLDTSQRRARLLAGIPRGQISSLRFVGATRSLAFTLATATQPPDAYTYEIDDQRLVRWTASETGGLPATRFITPSLVRVPSFDGLSVPVYYYRPRGRGPFPALVWVHGGPAEQFRPIFDPIVQYFAIELRIAVLAPNIRGSTGYGRRYRALDDGTKRADSIRDIGALLDWIEARPELAASRVGIHGASYGGYVVLASLADYGARIRAGSDLVGISNFVTFLESTRAYRSDLRREEYGDERDPATRAHLLSISPITNVDRIGSALLVAHGANDPRVPLAEAERLVEALRDKGQEAWFFRVDNEGHGFRKRRNRDLFYQVMASFFARHLLGGSEPARAATDPGAPEPPPAVDPPPEPGAANVTP